MNTQPSVPRIRPQTGHSPTGHSADPTAQNRSGFTRTELLALLLACTLLAAVVWPALANPRLRGERIACLNNLRQIGQGYQFWASEHGDRFPWWVPFPEGGLSNIDTATFPAWAGYRNNSWFQFAWISNMLASPRLLACPTDRSARVATQWGSSPEGGLAHPNFANNAVSYAIGLHSTYDLSQSLLCADRNMKTNGPTACSSGVYGVQITGWPVANTEWTPALHGQSGNYLSSDGQVRQLSSEQLRQAFQSFVGEWGASTLTHLLLPPR